MNPRRIFSSKKSENIYSLMSMAMAMITTCIFDELAK
jgi:hypothetical protein